MVGIGSRKFFALGFQNLPVFLVRRFSKPNRHHKNLFVGLHDSSRGGLWSGRTIDKSINGDTELFCDLPQRINTRVRDLSPLYVAESCLPYSALGSQVLLLDSLVLPNSSNLFHA